jgi:hypothetical protein
MLENNITEFFEKKKKEGEGLLNKHKNQYEKYKQELEMYRKIKQNLDDFLLQTAKELDDLLNESHFSKGLKKQIKNKLITLFKTSKTTDVSFGRTSVLLKDVDVLEISNDMKGRILSLPTSFQKITKSEHYNFLNENDLLNTTTVRNIVDTISRAPTLQDFFEGFQLYNTNLI